MPCQEGAEPEGFEPSNNSAEAPPHQVVAESPKDANTQIRAQMEDVWGCDLSRVVAAWSKISPPLRAAILAIVDAASPVNEEES